MIKKVLEIVDVRKLANAIYNNKPDVVKGILEPVPDHLSLYLTYLGIPLHHIAMFVEIAVSEHKGYNSPYDKPYHDNQIIKKLLSQKFVVDLDEEIPFYDYSLKFDLHTMGEQYIREDVFAENNLETLKRFDTNELDMELFIAGLILLILGVVRNVLTQEPPSTILKMRLLISLIFSMPPSIIMTWKSQ